MAGKQGMKSYPAELKKQEYLRHLPLPTFEQTHQAIDDYIHFYNSERIQLKTRQTPFELRRLSG